MSSFILKLIAMFTMLIDHLGYGIFKYTTFMNVIGRIAFPIFAFQISEGYIHTKDLKRYFLRLFLFALISQYPFMLFLSLFSNGFSLNIFFTLLGGLLSIYIYNKIHNTSFNLFNTSKLNAICKNSVAILPVICIGILAQVCKFDYGFFGITIIFLFYVLKNKKKSWLILIYSLVCIIQYIIKIITYGYNYLYIFLCLFTIIPIIFICLYNNKQGKKIKYVLYLFYPVHLFILYIIFGVLLYN